jgi:hypothetical protein
MASNLNNLTATTSADIAIFFAGLLLAGLLTICAYYIRKLILDIRILEADLAISEDSCGNFLNELASLQIAFNTQSKKLHNEIDKVTMYRKELRSYHEKEYSSRRSMMPIVSATLHLSRDFADRGTTLRARAKVPDVSFYVSHEELLQSPFTNSGPTREFANYVARKWAELYVADMGPQIFDFMRTGGRSNDGY